MSDQSIAAAFLNSTLNGNAPLLALIPGAFQPFKAETGTPFPYGTYQCMASVDWNGSTAAVYMANENRWAVYIIAEGLTEGGKYATAVKLIHSTLYCVSPITLSDGSIILGCTRNGCPPTYVETVGSQDYTHIGVGFYDLVTQDAAMAALSGL